MIRLLDKIVGTPEDRIWKKYRSLRERVNDLESHFEELTDGELREQTDLFRRQLNQGKSEDDILPEAFAVVREAAKRTLRQRHFDVQIVGGAVLHTQNKNRKGSIAEMKTGEGKTLVATLPAYLNALSGKGVHVVTVNDYLARRDPVWMGPIYHMLGLTVGCLQNDETFIYEPGATGKDPSYRHLRPTDRKDAYACDVLYGTNNEFGFDYLRDNMAVDPDLQVQRELNYAIIDEVDNILIDEARTPLIISGPSQDPVQFYYTMAKLAPRLRADSDFTMIDERSQAISLTDAGISKMQRWLKVDNLYSPENSHLVRYVENALKAIVLFNRNKEYVVRDGEVVIVDEFTGRLQPGRRWANGLHQAIEAKEGIPVRQETKTYATITLQNYFRMYEKLAGMTGTALTEEEEFLKIYGLEVVPIRTNAPFVRIDHADLIYQSETAKWKAVADDIEDMNRRQRPVLVGTTSIENSEKLSKLLERRGVSHQVLNAKQHEREAYVVAQAGRPGAVTVATNMAGRGTDIVLGGNPEGLHLDESEWQKDHNAVVEQGGLMVIGTEHHESRRIDNQLRGRSGRQGDPGETRFYASMEDEIIKRFGGERARDMMGKVSGWAGMDKGAPLESGVITKILEGAQSRVEGYHFEARKHLLDFDAALNGQRSKIYETRHEILHGDKLRASILGMAEEKIDELLSLHLTGNVDEDRDYRGLLENLRAIFPTLPESVDSEEELRATKPADLKTALVDHAGEAYNEKEEELGPDRMREIERIIMLRALDLHWVQQLTDIQELRQEIGLQAYGQRNPLVVYQKEARRRYRDLLTNMRDDVVHSVYRLSLAPAATPMKPVSNGRARSRNGAARKIGRNAPCYCGSGKKFKRCHGRG